MTLITINSGSTSVKLALYDSGATGEPRRIEDEHHTGHELDPQAVLGALARKLPAAPRAVAHRIVHGGTRFVQPTRIDDAVVKGIEALAPLAPLHNPVALRWLAAARALWGAPCVHVGVFDTAYFHDLPRVAAEYALSVELGAARGVRRYGFHGLAHESLWRGWCARRPDLPQGGRLITLQLGGGCSAAAIDRGRPVDTSMGFSPLEGLVMATRSGDVDAAVVPYLQRQLKQSADEVIALLNHAAGLAGISGTDKNPAELAADPAAQSQFAVELYCYRLRKYLGAYLAVLGGCDGIVFGGGVGEHVPQVRARALTNLAWAGILVDEKRNAAACGGNACISAEASAVRVDVIAADEESILARAAAAYC
jgi:acetate kinase